MRRALASALRILLLLIAALILAVVLLLKTDPGRNLVRVVAEGVVSDILPGRITIDRLAKVGLSEVRLEGVVVFDTSDRRVIAVNELSAEPNLRAIIGGLIELTQVDVQEPEVTLIFDADGQPSLLGAFVAPSEEPEPPGDPTVVELRSISVSDGVVLTTDPRFGDRTIEDLDVRVAIRIDDQFSVDLEHLSLALADSAGSLLRIDPLEATFDTTGGAESTALFTLSNSTDRIDVEAFVTMPTDDAPLTLRGALQLDPLTSSLLERMGLGDLIGTVPEWVTGDIAFEGTLDELWAGINLQTAGGDVRLSARAYELKRVELSLGTDGLTLNEVAPALPELFVATDIEGSWVLRDDGSMLVELQVEPTTLEGRGDLIDTVPDWVAGDIAFEGTPDELWADIDLQTEGGDVRLSAHVYEFQRVELSLGTDGLTLNEVAPSLPELFVATVLEGSWEMRDDGTMRIEAQVEPTTLDAYRVPALQAQATFDGERVTIEELQLPDLGSGLSVTGSVGVDGSADVVIRTAGLTLHDDPNFSALVPDVAGTVDVDMTVRYEPGDEPSIFTDGMLRVTRLAIPGLSAESIRLRGSVEGDLMSPVVDVDISTRGLVAPDFRIETASLRASGGPSRYRVVGSVDSSDGVSARLDVQARRTGQRLDASGDIDVTLEGETVTTRISGFELRENGAIRLARARVGYRDTSIVLSGSYSASGRVSAEAELSEFSLDLLSLLPGVPELPVSGIVSATASFSGRPERPEVNLDLRLSDGSFGPVERADVEVQLAYASSGASLSSQLEMADLGQAELRADATFLRPRTPVRALKNAEYDVTLDFTDLDLAPWMEAQIETESDSASDDESVALPDELPDELSDELPDEPPITGLVSGRLALMGTISDPNLALDLRVPSLKFTDVEPIDTITELRYANGELEADVAVSYLDRPLVELGAEVEFPWDSDDPFAAVEALETSRAHLRLRLPERAVQDFPLDLGTTTELSPHVLADLELARAPGGSPFGGARLAVRVDPDDWQSSEQICQSIQPVMVVAQLQLVDEIAQLSVDGRQRERQVLDIQTQAEVPIERWIREGLPETLSLLDVDATIMDLSLTALPVICKEGEGVVNGWAQVTDLLTDSPSVDLELQADELRLPGGVPVNLLASLHTAESGLESEVAITSEDGGAAILTAQFPFEWSLESPAPSLTDGPLSARADFENFAIAPIATLTPILRRGEGRVDGYVALGGTIDDIDPSGDLTFSGLDVSVPGLDQRLSGVSGQLEVSREELVIRNIRARDHGGTIRASGRLNAVDRDRPIIDLEVFTEDFPLRDAGVIVAYLTANITVDAEMGQERRNASITLQRVAIQLPEEAANTALSLDPNPDIIFVEDVGAALVDEVAVAPRSGPPLRLRVLAANPFWVRRQDFAVQLTVDLDVNIDAVSARISGELGVRRGWIELLSKRFELREGTLTFAGGDDVDPLLELTAVYAPRRDSSEAITVAITGRASEPQLAFTSTVAGVETETEIFQYLLTGRTSDESTQGQNLVESQVASVVSGLTTGLLTQAARRTLGSAAPTLSVRTGAYMRDVEVHAGFDANRLIPSFLQGIVTGMYVEGYVSTSSGDGETNTQRSTTGGVLIEFYYPRGFSTSGRFQPPANWSLDLLWQP